MVSVGIVILNYNDYDNTIRLVNKLITFNIIDKIVIVDNNSTDDSYLKLNLIKNIKVNVILSDKNGGYSYGNNLGLKTLETDYVIVSNPDVDIEEKDIIMCINYLKENNDTAISAPRMIIDNKYARRSSWKKRSLIIDIASSTRFTELLLYPIFKSGEYNKKYYEKDISIVDNIAGSFFIIKNEVLKKINFFDENVFLFYEEDILGEKIKNIGLKIASINNTTFIHYDSKTIKKVMSMYKKIDYLFESKKYFHKTYNNLKSTWIFDVLKIIRKIEIFFEINLYKIIKGDKQ